jgi:hypothetical protein
MSDDPRVATITINDSGTEHYKMRLLIGTAATGLVRIEWVSARLGLVIPMNWSNVLMTQGLDTYIPLRYQVADAQNLIAGEMVRGGYEWLLLYEHDVCPAPNAFLMLDEHMREKRPVVSGLYYNRDRPSLPLVFRGRGNGVHTDWKRGDQVWCDGVPTGFLLIHGSIIKAMWAESAEYQCYGQVTRRVFDTPRQVWFDPESEEYNAVSGTSDLDWCTRVMSGNFLGKAGWDEYANLQWPFLVDTRIFCKHVNHEGEVFP